MDSVTKLLVLCTFLSAIKLYDAATVTFQIDPVRPVLSSGLTFSCESNYNTNKLQKLSVLAGSSELLSYQPDKRPRVQWQSDETKARFEFKKELSKTRTFLQMTLKKPKCNDQNIYKCIYYEKGQPPIEKEIRLNFYVNKGKVEMINHRQSDCAPINITCIGQAGNPPEQMKWLKKRQGDSTYEEIEPAYIMGDRMSFHQSNCSNTRREHFRYTPSVDETDLVIKCGFGDEMEHMSFHSPVVVPEDFEITVKPEGEHNVGDEIQLTCAGLGITDKTVFKWFKKTKDHRGVVEIMPVAEESNFDHADDMCHTNVQQMIAYSPEVNDEIIYCEIEDNGHKATAQWAIQLNGVISNPTDGITTKDVDDKMDNGMDGKMDGSEEMTTIDSMSEKDTDDDDKDDSEEEDKSKDTKTDTSMSGSSEQENGQLRSCLSSAILISSLLVVAFQFMLELSS